MMNITLYIQELNQLNMKLNNEPTSNPLCGKLIRHTLTATPRAGDFSPTMSKIDF